METRRSAGGSDGAVRIERAIVTGGASGIGRACVRLLSDAGARCVIVDRNRDLGEQTSAETGSVFVEANVADEEQVLVAVHAAAEMAPLRMLVNAAGIAHGGRTLDRARAPLEQRKFDRVIEVNLLGTFNCIRLAASCMSANQPVAADGVRGAIVNISSIAAFDGQVGQAAYTASKGAIVAMTLPIARDLASVGIRVNTLAPGLIDTPIYGEGEQAEEFKDRLMRNLLYPRRLGTPEEIASMVMELLTNDYMNGETVRVDGGIRMPPK